MKRKFYILFLHAISCFFTLPGLSQVSFKTIIPQRPILINESFQVQFVIENATEISNFSLPVLTGLRVVTGPNIYSARGVNSRTNLVVTLAATREGKLKIPGASCLVNGKLLKSNDVIVTVVSPKQTDESGYFLKPGEDPYKKIRQNLFLKLEVDKRTCYVGEPIVATFKLYSRLQSRSNIVKNPGFYGFSVYDMVDVNDQVQSEERIHGHWFDVHTVRKLQLYPLQPGIFTIDPMELTNQIEFSTIQPKGSARQSVTENMYNQDTATERTAGASEYESTVKSDPVVIDVRPLPGKNKADTFAGAVGSFSINAFVARDSVLRNEEDSLMIEINGDGNFQRVTAPLVTWPTTFEYFEPSVKDTFDKEQVPLRGQRRFKYVFVCNHPGFYTIPSVSFTFFDLRSSMYKTVSTKPFTIFISAKSKNDRSSIVPDILPESIDRSNWMLIAAGLLVLITGILLWTINRKRSRRVRKQKELSDFANPFFSVHDILEPASLSINDDEKVFYERLNRCIWDYFHNRLADSNTPMIKKELSGILVSKGVDRGLVTRLMEIVHQCETGVYTKVEINVNKTELLENTNHILLAMEAFLRSS